jgi:hypothetical protein
MQQCNFPRKLLAIHILGLSGLLAMPAQATIITNSLTATASAKAGTNAATVEGPQTDASYVSQYAFNNDGISNTGASAWGNQYGVYRAEANGNGKFDSNGHFQRALTLTNNNGIATDYSVSFFIYYGSMSASSNGATGTGWGSFDLSIKRDANTLFASYAKIESDGTLTQTGTALNGATQSGSFYSWDGTYVNFNLGTLENNESLTLNFDLVSTAFGDFGVSSSNECYGGYGSEFATFAVNDGYGGCTGFVSASLGDPVDFDENNPALYDPNQFPFRTPFNTLVINERRIPTNDVPLPGTLALLGIGLAGVGLMRKRRQG